MGAESIIPVASIKNPLLYEVKLHSKEPCLWVQVRAQNTAYLLNKSEGPLSLTANDEICGFGKGRVKLGKPDQVPQGAEDGKGVQFLLQDHTTLIVLNGVVTTVGKACVAEWSKKPTAAVCYHSVKRAEDNPNHFQLEPTHNVFFVPSSDGSEKVSQFNIGSKLNFNHWLDSSSNECQVLWHCKWYGVKVRGSST